MHELPHELPGTTSANNVASFAIGDRLPDYVARPASEQEVVDILNWANRTKATVIPWGAGTKIQAAFAPEKYEIALDLRGLNGIVEYEPADMTITVKSGHLLSHLTQEISRDRLMLPLDTLTNRSTLGGMVAADLACPLSRHYGRPHDLLLGVRVVLGNGQLIHWGGRVVKNVAGFDLPKLFSGSWGSLGVITEVSFKLLPVPERQVIVLLTGSGLSGSLGFCRKLRAYNKAQLLPILIHPGTDNGEPFQGGPITIAVLIQDFVENVKFAVEELSAMAHSSGLERFNIVDEPEELDSKLHLWGTRPCAGTDSSSIESSDTGAASDAEATRDSAVNGLEVDFRVHPMRIEALIGRLLEHGPFSSLRIDPVMGNIRCVIRSEGRSEEVAGHVFEAATEFGAQVYAISGDTAVKRANEEQLRARSTGSQQLRMSRKLKYLMDPNSVLWAGRLPRESGCGC